METLFEFIIVFVIFFIVSYGAYYITEIKGLPQWLQYKPWICRLCLTFWTLVFAYVAIWVSFSCLIVGIFGNLLAVMNAAAMWIDQKEKTVSLEDYTEEESKTVDCDEIRIEDNNIVVYNNGEIVDLNEL